MTTIDIAGTPVFAPRVAQTRLRLTVRGRRVLAGLAAVPAIVALSIAILSGGGALASGEGNAPAGTYEQLTVLPGDTLWSIAEAIAPDADPRDVVGELMRLNALPSGELVAGQSIAVPLEYSAQR